jgi:serine/threonine protein kinase
MPKDRYEILGTLGCGATSRVDKARDTVLGRTVALKTLVHAFGAPVEQKQFLREAQIVSQLSHPAIINLYDVGIEDGNVAYLVMEYVSGKTLQQMLSESPIPLPRACGWAADLAGALGSAHRAGIIHGDVKPGNILVTEDGNVKLGDFGIARFATQVSGSGRMMGTPAYLSPEQILGEPQNTKSDLFSLGIVLYQMVTGVPPFEGSSVSAVCAQILSAEPMPPSQRNPAIPAGLDHIILRCLAKSSADRYPSAEALAASLYPFVRNTWEPAAPSAPDAASSAPPAARAKSSWFTRPVQAREAWIAAAIGVLAAGSVVFYRDVASQWRLPAAPVIATAAPKPPLDLLGYSIAPTWDDVESNAVEEAPQPEEPPRPQASQKAHAPHLRASVARTQPSRAIVPAKNVAGDSSVSAPELFSPPASAISRGVDRAALHIEIDSIVGDGALAIFADQSLVFTTELHTGAPGQPIRLERALPAGPHELRVALYRPDQSLQTMKEGLGVIRTDTVNTLRIHIGRRSKMLVRRETSLDVSWPSAIAASTGGAAPPSFSASTK